MSVNSYKLKGLAISLLFFCLPVSACQLVIENVIIIDASQTQPRDNQTVVIDNGKIRSITQGGNSHTATCNKVDGKRKYLIPGLWDMHVHLADAGQDALPNILSHGVTSVRDMGGELSTINSFRKAIKKGEVSGPRIFAAGYMIESPMLWEFIEKTFGKGEMTRRILVSNPEQAKAAVKKIAESGGDFVKLHSNHDQATYDAVLESAEKHNLQVAGHFPRGVIDLALLAKSGIDSIEHPGFGYWLDHSKESPEIIYKHLSQHQVHIVPTVNAFSIMEKTAKATTDEQRIEILMQGQPGALLTSTLRDFWVKFFKQGPPPPAAAFKRDFEVFSEMNQANVPIMAGTDLGIPGVLPGRGLHDEMIALVNTIKLTPYQAIVAATWVPADYSGEGNRLGTVEIGKIADLVLLDANPLESIENIRKVNLVLKEGEIAK